MSKNLIDVVLLAGVTMAALAIATVCCVGLVVWLAGGRPGQNKGPHVT